jgi:ankyrin repeat protein
MTRKPEVSTQLFTAAESGQCSVLESILAKKGIKVNAKEPTFGMTALHLAASKGHKEAVEVLLENGSDIEAREDTGRTSLHAASFRGQLQVVEFLVAKGAKINAQTKDGKTPLDWAVLSQKSDVANFIRENGGKCGKDLTSAPKAAAAG